jgi:hypothetical protein
MENPRGNGSLYTDMRHLVALEDGSLRRLEIEFELPGGRGAMARVSAPVSDYALLMDTISKLVAKHLDQTGLVATIHVRLHDQHVRTRRPLPSADRAWACSDCHASK